MELSPADVRWLQSAARIAMPWRGTTADNPTVGALVVSAQDVVVGRGVTAPGGRPHAEPQALKMAGEGARGASLYVTLEPCNHWGRTPPCVDAVLKAGLARVVIGSADPDPRTAGQSIAKLRAAGIAVAVGSRLPFIERLHEGFLSRIRRGRPFVVAKLAISGDGKIGRRDSGNVAVTGKVARQWSHMQRALSEAVMVGAATARIDDPRLNVRLPGLQERTPLRVALAGAKGLAADLNLFSMKTGQTTVVIAENSISELVSRHAEIISVEGSRGRPDLNRAFEALSLRGVGRVLVEGGAAINEALLEAGLIDRFHLLESEIEIGADGVPASTHGSLSERLLHLGFVQVERRALGCDMLTTFEKV